jgi:hypothetical protein
MFILSCRHFFGVFFFGVIQVVFLRGLVQVVLRFAIVQSSPANDHCCRAGTSPRRWGKRDRLTPSAKGFRAFNQCAAGAATSISYYNAARPNVTSEIPNASASRWRSVSEPVPPLSSCVIVQSDTFAFFARLVIVWFAESLCTRRLSALHDIAICPPSFPSKQSRRRPLQAAT